MNAALLATYARRTYPATCVVGRPNFDDRARMIAASGEPVPWTFVGPVDAIDAEYRWVSENVASPWRVERQSLVEHDGRLHDVLRVRSPAGLRDYHFDVDDFYRGPSAYANQTPCRENHIGTSGCSHDYARFVFESRQAHPPTPPAPAGLPSGEPTFAFEQATATPYYRRKSDGAEFRKGYQGRRMDGPTQLIPLDGGAPFEVRTPVLDRDYDKFLDLRPIAPAGLAYAPAGDALSDALGPLLSSGALDRTVDRLGNILIDRLLAQPAVQREVGGAIGKAAVTELSRGVGKPYMVGLTLAAGVGAASLLALAFGYLLKK